MDQLFNGFSKSFRRNEKFDTESRTCLKCSGTFDTIVRTGEFKRNFCDSCNRLRHQASSRAQSSSK